MKKRLLKDLPFCQLTVGTVLTKANGGYHVDNGDTIYVGGGSCHRGWMGLDKSECGIVDMIWENKDWFVDAKVTAIEMKVHTDKIVLSFEALDLGQAQTFAKGIKRCLRDFGNEDGSYAWHEFKGFEISLS